MHPAYSVIAFTTASGAGYGLLFWLGLAHLAAAGPGRWTSLVVLVMALVLVTGGLLSSTLHLGRPERAWRAFSQWRSSWLSREGVAAVATYLPAGALGLVWLVGLEAPGAVRVLGGLAALGAVATVWCTGMIYASLRTIRQWHRPEVPLVYLALAAGTGGLLFALMLALRGRGDAAAVLAAAALGAALLAKLVNLAAIDRTPGRLTAADALGLPRGTRVRVLDPPHTQPNFVMREMGYRVARRHALKLRRFMLAALFALPIPLALLAALWSAGAPWLLSLATLSAAAGVLVERWLFFAEAEHLSMLYYGAGRA